MEIPNNNQSSLRSSKSIINFRLSISKPFLLKYFPKYCQKIDFHPIDCELGPVLSKIKRIKKFDFVFSASSSHLTIELLKDKRRFLKDSLPKGYYAKYFPNVIEHHTRLRLTSSLREFYLLKKIERLTLCPHKYSEKVAWRFWKHFGSLKHLKSLKIEPVPKLDNRFYKFLLSTETFKNITQLTLKLFVTINIEDMEKLRTIYQSIPEAQNLKYLQDLDKLQCLTIKIALNSNLNFENFMENFQLPSSLRKIELCFKDIDWSCLIPNISKEDFSLQNPFENNKVCCEFYDKWSKLQKLEILEIKFHKAQKIRVSNVYFMFPILRRLSSLAVFKCYSKYGRRTEKNLKCLEFNKILEGITPLKSTLREVLIDDKEISVANLNHETLTTFPNLKDLTISGQIFGDDQVGKLIDLFQEHDQQESYRMKLDKVIIEGKESFQAFLESFKKHAHKKNLDISINIDVGDFPVHSFQKTLVDFIRQAYKIPNLTLKLLILDEDSNNFDGLQTLLKEYDTFKILLDSNLMEFLRFSSSSSSEIV